MRADVGNALLTQEAAVTLSSSRSQEGKSPNPLCAPSEDHLVGTSLRSASKGNRLRQEQRSATATFWRTRMDSAHCRLPTEDIRRQDSKIRRVSAAQNARVSAVPTSMREAFE